MSMNRIQFQLGLSLPEFLRAFGSEAQCEQALFTARWPQGWQCPRCGHEAHYRLARAAHGLFQCQACAHQSSLRVPGRRDQPVHPNVSSLRSPQPLALLIMARGELRLSTEAV